jgi:hypothetical protein
MSMPRPGPRHRLRGVGGTQGSATSPPPPARSTHETPDLGNGPHTVGVIQTPKPQHPRTPETVTPIALTGPARWTMDGPHQALGARQ